MCCESSTSCPTSAFCHSLLLGQSYRLPPRETAITGAVTPFRGDQRSFRPLGTELEERLRFILEARFDELPATRDDGFSPRWITPGHEILITWQPKAERRAQ
jgi:hypothetical protein